MTINLLVSPSHSVNSMYILVLVLFYLMVFSNSFFMREINRNSLTNRRISIATLKALKLGNFGRKKESSCKTCKNTGILECRICKGTGIDKINGNAMERWKCKNCQGFQYISCPNCKSLGSGLTPEQRGEQ